MHQNLAVILRHLCYGKISFIILIPTDANRVLLPTKRVPYPELVFGVGRQLVDHRVGEFCGFHFRPLGPLLVGGLSKLDLVLLNRSASILFRNLPLEADRGCFKAADLETCGGVRGASEVNIEVVLHGTHCSISTQQKITLN